MRNGDAVVVLGGGPLLHRALLAGAGVEPEDPEGLARVAVVTAAYDVPTAVARLQPGGRLVALAADRAAAERTAARHGLVLRHVEPLDGRVAWSAVLPVSP